MKKILFILSINIIILYQIYSQENLDNNYTNFENDLKQNDNNLKSSKETDKIFEQVPDQISNYIDIIKMNKKKEIQDQDRILKEMQKEHEKKIKVPAIDFGKIKKNNVIKKYKPTEEDKLLNTNDNYRKMKISKPFIVDGVVNYTYGIGEPIIICSILNVCDIELGKGESISNVQIGDSERWILKISSTSSPENKSHIFIKPKEKNLRSNLIVFTDKRQYNLQLKSISKKYFTKVTFKYLDEGNKLTTVYNNIPEVSKHKYYIRGDSTSWTPEEIRTDNKKTYIKLPKKFTYSPDAPTIYSLDSDGSKSQVNYRFYNGWIVIDVALDQGQLIQGIGLDQKKVIFTKKGTVGIISKLLSKG